MKERKIHDDIGIKERKEGGRKGKRRLSDNAYPLLR